jgi:gamma-glutamyltranspeptidase/glutathione hydrolase
MRANRQHDAIRSERNDVGEMQRDRIAGSGHGDAQRFQWNLPYGLRRVPIFARNVVTTTQPLAAQAGLEMLRQGGNAVDAAVATAIALTVVEPVSCGLGSDGLAIVWDGAQTHGLNATGRSPRAATLDKFAGMTSGPQAGWHSVTVPAVVSGWVALWKEFGRLPFPKLFAPAIGYARDGFLVTPTIARIWRGLRSLYAEYPDALRLFFPHGASPEAGTLVTFPDIARTLEVVADSEGTDFYLGSLARQIADYSKRDGGLLTLGDLEEHSAEWVQPLKIGYRDVELHELPPNGQGLAALIALGVLNHFDLSAFPLESADSLHLQIEAMRLGFADVYRHVSDPQTMRIDPEAFLDPRYLARRASEISLTEAKFPKTGFPIDGGTTYVAAADAEGLVVSYIQSSGRGFGSGMVVPNTGIALQCRGRSFSLDPSHSNCLGPRKLPFHTNIPAFVVRDGRLFACFGLMGWNMQPQAHVQFLTRLVDYGQNPQAALESPRWRLAMDEAAILLEEETRAEVHAGLESRGHRIIEIEPTFPQATTPFGSQLSFGAAQMIFALEDGYIAASDPRRDGQAVGF